MGFDFDIPHSPFRDDADDIRLGGDSSTSTPVSSQGWTSSTSTSHSNMGDEVRPPVLTRTYHPDINGMCLLLIFMKSHVFILIAGRICDQHGDDIPLNTPLPLHPSEQEPDDWAPYNDRVEFEVVDFLFQRNQMSAGDIDFILNLWAASLAAHGEAPPFASHVDMYSTIDATPIGDVAWDSFSSRYNGAKPAGEMPSWMTAEYEVWFRDPRLLVHNILSNPDFKNEFDYMPVQEYSAEGVHRFQNFMSGDWCWKQAVRLFFYRYLLYLIFVIGLDCRGS